MGQKANTLTLRKDTNRLESYASNSKTFLSTNEYINTLKRSLEKKNVIIISHSFNATTDTFNLSLNLFFKTRKVQKYLKKKFKVKLSDTTYNNKMWAQWRKEEHMKLLKRKKRNFGGALPRWILEKEKIRCLFKVWRSYKKFGRLRKKYRFIKWISRNRRRTRKFLIKKASKTIGWTKTLSNLTKDLPSNSIMINKITLVNKQINLRIVRIMHSNLRYFKKMLFSRRFDLYYDFLKLTSLLITRKLKIAVYITILGRIFKYLMKKSHNKFFKFLKKLSHILIKSSTIDGVKFGLNGKLKGKLRAKSFRLEVGKIGVQTIASDIDFSKVHINTLYGCFGLRIWIKYKDEEEEKKKKKDEAEAKE